jgi:hypothetical protein
MKKGEKTTGNVQLTESNQSIDHENGAATKTSELVSIKSSSSIEDIDLKFAKNKEFKSRALIL